MLWHDAQLNETRYNIPCNSCTASTDGIHDNVKGTCAPQQYVATEGDCIALRM